MRDRNPKKQRKCRMSPRASGAENAIDGKAPARHQDGTDQHPRCTSRSKPPGDRTGRTRDVEFSEGIYKYRDGHPDRLFAESPATSTTPRARPDSFTLGRAQARCPYRPRSPRVATPWWLCHLEQRGSHHLLDHCGGPANDRGLMTRSCSEMTHLV